MSKQLFAIPLLLLSLLLGACSDEEEGRINIDDSAPAQVTNVVATSVAGGVTLSWDNPSSKSFMYTKLAYTNAKGTETYELYSKEHADDAGKMQTTINGFVKTEPVTFKIFACSVRGNNSGAVEVQGTPGAPNFAKVLDKITVDPSYGGIKVRYINEFDENVIVSVSYKSTSDASKSGSCKFAVSPKSQGAQFVRLTYGNDNQFITNEKCEITIHTEDNYDNASDDRTYQVTPLAAQILDRSKWSVPGYDNNSSAATIGYDSQEAVGEGASNGRVICMFDGSTKTFWHTKWKNGNDKYPHWFIVDLGREHTLASIEITGRVKNNKEQTGEQIFVCTNAGATDPSNPSNWEWNDMGEYSFDPNNDAPQNIDLTNQLPKARYIKVYIGEKFKGSSDNAMISEFNVYTID